MIELPIRNEVNIGRPIRKESSWCRSTIFKLANDCQRRMHISCTHTHTHIRCWYHCHCVEISPGSNKTKHKNQKNNVRNAWEWIMGSSSFYVFSRFFVLLFFFFGLLFYFCGKYEERIAWRKEEIDDNDLTERKKYEQNFTVTTGSGLQDAGA